jgi:broad specificity phosphatase PhoE
MERVTRAACIPQSMLPRIYLIRHGETEWSASGQHTSYTDIPLNTRGEEAARELGQQLRTIQFARVLTSPRLRGRRTCELAGLPLSGQIEPDLAEWNYGDYEGRRSVEIRAERPEWNLFHDGCPKGETPIQISERADRFIARLRQMEGNIALFSHGHFGRVLATRWIGLPVSEAQHFLLDTASVGILGFEQACAESPVIVTWNLTARSLSRAEPSAGLPATSAPQ